MKVLLTNDDGIYAKGLMALYNELCGDFDVKVVAPESEMSAVGHAISLSSPLMVRRVFRNDSFFGYGVKGTPADCVKIAVQELLDAKPDIIISGINLGANVGVNVLYSGTVSAATEGAFFGIKSAAISLNTRVDPDYNFAARFSREVIRYMDENDLKSGIALNVNIPALPAERIKGVAITRQGVGRFEESFERRIDPRGNVYYWLTGETPLEEDASDTDANALKKGMITITPVTYDLTSRDELRRLQTLPCRLSDFVRQASGGKKDFSDLDIK
ncbi:MAG: 5'/3'-nucleotidase SurE [Deltaproteobacteria bacterium]|nr:5'/3'-nucleotidase SurE [Deltaproteobacteria bacterium]